MHFASGIFGQVHHPEEFALLLKAVVPIVPNARRTVLTAFSGDDDYAV
jgi:hypothetical protein